MNQIYGNIPRGFVLLSAFMFVLLCQASVFAAEKADAPQGIEKCKSYLTGSGVKVDEQKVLQCFKKDGSPIAMLFIANMYEDGTGVKQDYGKAMEWYVKAADKGNEDALFRIGYLYDLGLGVNQNYQKAIAWYRKAANKGDAAAMRNIGVLYEDGLGVDQDYKQAMKWYRKAADKGNAGAMFNIGYFYGKGQGVEQNYKKAMEWYREAADKGESYAMLGIGILYMRGEGVSQNSQKAFDWYLKAANAGNVNAMKRVALEYDLGSGVKQDYEKAIDWYNTAANYGDADAERESVELMMDAGYHYDGLGSEGAKAIEWYKRAAEKGRADAMDRIGDLYAQGKGVGQDYQNALEWYRKAADKGDISAMTSIGYMYGLGRGVARNDRQAFNWHLKAAELGSGNSMREIAQCYEYGSGVQQDIERAEGWLRKADDADVKLNAAIKAQEADLEAKRAGIALQKPTINSKASAKVSPFLVIGDVKFYEPSGNKILDAFETGKIQVSAKNDGKGLAMDVKLQIAFSDKAHTVNGLTFNETTSLGIMQPGDEKKIDVSITAREDVPTAGVELNAILVEGSGLDSAPTILAFSTGKLIPPRLEVARIEIEDPDGKRVLGKGKQTKVNLFVQNAGAGEARNVEAAMGIYNENIKLYSDGVIKLGNINPGESKKATFDIVVSNRYSGDKTLPVRFTVKESTDRFTIKPEIALRLGEEAPDIMVVRVKPQDELKSFAEKADDINMIPALDKLQMVFGQNDLAVVIGIEKYQNISNSEFSYNDAKLVRGYLKALGFADRNIEFITDERATRSGIEKSVEHWLPNRVKKGSRVFIYFSGHGSPDPTTGEPYIVPHDADLNYLTTTGYPLKRLYAQLAKLEAKDVIVALDSCFSGAGGKGVLARGAKPALPVIEDPLLAAQNIAVITSSEGIQISTSIPDKGYSLFTYYFLKAIKDGKGDLVDIYQYIKPLVEDEARGINVAQSPSLRPGAETLKGRFALRR